MSNLLLLICSALLISCASNRGALEKMSPGYQYGRQMDEKSLRSGFMERR